MEDIQKHAAFSVKWRGFLLPMSQVKLVTHRSSLTKVPSDYRVLKLCSLGTNRRRLECLELSEFLSFLAKKKVQVK